jgi:hypothetical protein
MDTCDFASAALLSLTSGVIPPRNLLPSGALHPTILALTTQVPATTPIVRFMPMVKHGTGGKERDGGSSRRRHQRDAGLRGMGA